VFASAFIIVVAWLLERTDKPPPKKPGLGGALPSSWLGGGSGTNRRPGLG